MKDSLAVCGPRAAWFAEQFPVHMLYSGVRLGYQIGSVLGGGLMPMIAALLFSLGGNEPWLIAGYLSVLAALSIVAALFAADPARDRPGVDLGDLHDSGASIRAADPEDPPDSIPTEAEAEPALAATERTTR
ncbi:hypothetical protein AA0Z99_13045 [Agrococcus sp. 1P02AA]|uniref:hypothetical protein n=1 Tax=Agrococcus sp. 1P02AA TaxID=3132259 RepID=UPI0039A5E477